jgi:hypothetical protein
MPVLKWNSVDEGGKARATKNQRIRRRNGLPLTVRRTLIQLLVCEKAHPHPNFYQRRFLGKGIATGSVGGFSGD